MHWHVLYTKPRNEKKVTERLQQLGFTVFCPLTEVLQQWSDRKKRIQKPLLPSYVFIKIDEAKRQEVFQVAGIVRYLYWLGKPALVTDHEIALLQSWNQKFGAELRVESLTPGTRITLPNGLFKGVNAIVKEQRGRKLQLVLESLGIVIFMETAP
ncbi:MULTISPECIES: UpxY family transcription antiterminator [Flavobacterium]|uniref:UpxY family transcription antiterminator n=1 Tax=Flavobacterium sedimenticola TaxID=3043286 RepID=A0ABT6XRS0_9FLAO|nr:UpxY family transcription antiterminator [Flavobacterium sedimenticola]MDI9257718.1 UpxY family transcription antiterminator [Flavobacterium sedimenticola]